MKINEITSIQQLDEMLPLPKAKDKPQWMIDKINRAKEREAKRNEKPGQLKRNEKPSQVKANVKKNLDFVDQLEKDGVSEAKKLEPSKPRNFVAKNATTGGAGAHKDKKKAEKQGDVKHKGKELNDIDETLQNVGTVGAVSPDGKQVTVKQADGTDITTTADAFLPGPNNTVAMKPDAAGAGLKPGAQVTQDTSMEEEEEEETIPLAPSDGGIHAETDVDLMGSGHNRNIGGDPTDRFINQVRDKGFERAARGGGDRAGFAGRAKLSESDELMKMLTIAGLK